MNTQIYNHQPCLFDQQAAVSLSQAPNKQHLEDATATPWCSEVSLSGRAEHCLHLLAPMLKLLSEQQEERWLALVSPPEALTMQWLRNAGLNPQRTLILRPKGLQSSQELACQVLELGCSHTVITWLSPLPTVARLRLSQAAEAGQAQSINISQHFGSL